MLFRSRRLVDGLEGQWLRRLAAVDARGAAGADQDQPALSTASWLRNRLRMGAGTATSSVRTARALFRGALPETAAALVAGDISSAHATVVAEGTRDLPEHVQLDADLVLVELARRLDPPGLRRAVDHLCQVADPDSDPGPPLGLQARLRAAVALLPPALGGAPSRPLEVGRATRVLSRPSPRPWLCATMAVSFPVVIAPWPGATAII